ncbi:unnamed protein product [Dracunculus medinensis]|uniref:Calmodulin-lysine N-methyltransferase n=1 Tax=Dracunculus medinensis TaxID=318479 RepID=A0A3P7QUH4_DRAME|nr:unnamed protein product [Dracunculus medinensis]
MKHDEKQVKRRRDFARYRWRLLSRNLLKLRDENYRSEQNFIIFDAIKKSDPSECGSWYHVKECLAYYFLLNKDLCEHKSLLEIGAGMTGLIGLAAITANANRVVITDGHKKSVENLKRIFERNNLFHHHRVECLQLDWNDRLDIGQFDIIACADCLFFVESHNVLLDCIDNYLKNDGIAYIMAPRRNGTAEGFIILVNQQKLYWNVYHLKFPFNSYFENLDQNSSDSIVPLFFCLHKKNA